MDNFNRPLKRSFSLWGIESEAPAINHDDKHRERRQRTRANNAQHFSSDISIQLYASSDCYVVVSTIFVWFLSLHKNGL